MRLNSTNANVYIFLYFEVLKFSLALATEGSLSQSHSKFVRRHLIIFDTVFKLGNAYDGDGELIMRAKHLKDNDAGYLNPDLDWHIAVLIF